MFKRQVNYNNKLVDIRSTTFSYFGIMGNDGFDIANISDHIKTFSNYKELEVELNKLARYIYDGKRRIVFHEFRQFPYIIHGEDNENDMCGYAQNYTSSDIYLIKFIRKFVTYKCGKYAFFNIDFIIQNTKKIEIIECPICDMRIDVILR